MAELYPQPKQQYFDSNGDPLVGGKVYTYAAGSVGTGTPKATYTTAAASTENANPVVLDSRGEATIYWDGLYKVILKDINDVLIWTQDYVPTTSGAGADTNLVIPGAIPVSNTPDFTTYYSVQWAGAVSDGVTDDTVACNLAADRARDAGLVTLYFPYGTTLTGTVDITGLSVYIDGEIQGLPGEDVLYWKAPDEGGHGAPPQGTRIVGRVRVDDSIDVATTLQRWGAGGERIGNCGLIFACPNNVVTDLFLPPYLTIDLTVNYTLGLNPDIGYNNQCAFFCGQGSYVYGSAVHIHAQSISYGWIDGIAGARAAAFNSSTDVVTVASHGYANGDIVAVLSDGGVYDASGTYTLSGVYTVLPGGLIPRSAYYVIGATTNTFQLSLTSGGAAVDITSNGSDCAIAPFNTSALNGGSGGDGMTVSFNISAIGKVGFSFAAHAFMTGVNFDIHANVWGRCYNYPVLANTGSGFSNFAVTYSEGPVGNFAGDTFMSGKEYMRFEWPTINMFGLQFSPVYATNVFASIVSANGNFQFGVVQSGTVKINVLAPRARVSADNSTTHSCITLLSNANFVTYGKITSGGQVNAGYEPEVLGDTTLLGAPGGVNGDWLETNPSSFYRNKRTLLVPGANTAPDSVVTGLWSYDFTDTSLKIPGAIVLPYALSGAALQTWTGSNLTSEQIRVGEFLPASTGTLYCNAKASTACNVNFSAGGVTSATTVMALTTSYQSFAVRYDARLASPLALASAVFGTPSVSAITYVNYFQFVPDAELTRTNHVALADSGSGTTPQNNIYGGTGAPGNGLGSNGDYYFRNDGGASTHIYVKAAGSWSGLI